MRVAALYDIHGNLPALEAVLQDIIQAGVDQIVIGGDIVPGPMPREVLECLLDFKIPIQFIYGNCEKEILAVMQGKEPSFSPQFHESVRWVAQQFTPEDESLMASWTKTLRLNIAGAGTVLFCHATPRDENEIFTELTPEDRLLPIFEEPNVDVVVCGHTHMQFDRMVGKTRVVNAGSVGQPFGKPAAYWLLFEPNIQLRRTDYDLAQAAERIRGTNYPLAEDFAANSVLHPPAADEMLKLYTEAGLK